MSANNHSTEMPKVCFLADILLLDFLKPSNISTVVSADPWL